MHDGTGKPVQSVETLVSEIDHLFAAFTKRGKMILLMHDEMFQDRFDGRTKLTALIASLKQRGYVFGRIDGCDDQGGAERGIPTRCCASRTLLRMSAMRATDDHRLPHECLLSAGKLTSG